ncbi:MAG: extracellular solute-binding protein, partial [Yaniella sp.]|nr:extracellular solute-binding protein [Yaniella sp.]
MMRHHNLSRRLLTALAVVGIVGGVSGCAAQGEPDKSEPIEIWSRSAPDGAATYEEVFKAFTKKTGIEVNYQPVMEFDTQLQSRAASKDLPDMWINDAGLMGTYNAQGWLSPVTVTDFAGHGQISDDTWDQNVAPDGATYGVPWSRQAFATVIRKDWREKLGYEVPKNWDDLADLAHAFATEDPDGNGKDDTSGMVVPGTAQNGYFGWW